MAYKLQQCSPSHLSSYMKCIAENVGAIQNEFLFDERTGDWFKKPSGPDGLELKIIIMVIYKCYFSRKHIALSQKHNLNMKLRNPINQKALYMMQNNCWNK